MTTVKLLTGWHNWLIQTPSTAQYMHDLTSAWETKFLLIGWPNLKIKKNNNNKKIKKVFFWQEEWAMIALWAGQFAGQLCQLRRWLQLELAEGIPPRDQAKQTRAASGEGTSLPSWERGQTGLCKVSAHGNGKLSTTPTLSTAERSNCISSPMQSLAQCRLDFKWTTV